MASTKDSAQEVGTAVTGGIGVQNPSAALQGATNATQLSANCIYEGIVVSSSVMTRLVAVAVNGVILENCQMMCGAVGSFVGTQDIALPLAGSKVLVVHCLTTNYVLGGQLEVKASNTTWAPPITGDIEYDVLEKSEPMKANTAAKSMPVTAGLKVPIDMFPGEWQKTTGVGPAIRLLLNFAQLDSGSLAKIETHLMNDMVRIVDNYFVHHHVGGDDLIWSNERNTLESHFTQYPHEAEGKLDEHESLTEMQEKAFDPKSKCEPSISSATGRWRKSTYIGFLGDMIHTWVTHPTEVASSLMGDDEADRATNFRQWIGSDGTYMVQAGGGLQLEAGGKPICPTVNYAWNDPKFDLKQAMQQLDSKYLKIWGNGPDWEDLKVSCWQMRTYLRYIPLWHSLARWRQLENSGFCHIPIQNSAPDGNPGAGEEDRKGVTGEDPYLGYAAINLSPAGTVTITNGLRGSIIMDEKCIQVAAAGNIELKAGGNLILSGRNVVIQGADNVEISSFFGAIVMKARTTLKALVEKGRLWFKSDMDPEDTDSPDYPLDGEQPEVEQKEYSIILDAPNGSILNYGKKGFVAATNDEEAHIQLEAAGKEADVNIVSGNHINFFASKWLKIRSTLLGLVAPTAKFVTSTLKIGDRFKLKGGELSVNNISATSIKASSMTDKTGIVNKKEDIEEPDFEDDKADEIGDEASEMKKKDLVSDYKEKELKDLSFEMPYWDKTSDPMDWRSYKGSAWDDSIQNTNELDDEYVQLNLQDTKLLKSTRTSTVNLPWPGNNAKLLLYDGGPQQSLATPMRNDFDEDYIGSAYELTPTEFLRNYSKKDN